MDRRSFVRTSFRAGLAASLGPAIRRLPLQAFGASTSEGILYNGIRLPDPFPPELDAPLDVDHVPYYLKDPPSPIHIDTGRQLFVDEFLVESMVRCKRRFHQPEPGDGNPLLSPLEDEFYTVRDSDGRLFRIRFACPYSDGVWWDESRGRFRAWFTAGLNTLRLAESDDGFSWDRVGPGNGSDVVMHIPSRRDSGSVWIDPSDPDPARRYKLAFFSLEDNRNRVFLSPDGATWPSHDNPHAVTEVYSSNPSIAIGDRTTFFYNPFRRKWVWSLRDLTDLQSLGGWKADRIRRYLEGDDLHSAAARASENTYWLRGGEADFARAGKNAARTLSQLYNVDGFAYESIMCFLFTIFTGPTVVDWEAGQALPKVNNVHIAFSRDGFHASRPPTSDRVPFISIGEPGSWNEGNVQSVGGGCVIVGPQESEELLFYHSGMHYEISPAGVAEGRVCMGSVRLRRDGFASVDAETDEGILTTRLVQFDQLQASLFVNTDSAGGSLLAEVLNENGDVIAGFEKTRCTPVTTNSTKVQVNWADQSPLTGLSGRPIRFRFYLRSASLYSFWVSESESGESGGFVAAGGSAYSGYRDGAAPSSTGIRGPRQIPSRIRLDQNAPNPFREQTTIGYRLDGPAHVRLTLFDELGRHVATLVDSMHAAGSHTVHFDGTRLAPGLYVCHMEASGREATIRMTRIR